MPRRAIIITLVILILGILGGTMTLVLSRLQSSTNQLAQSSVTPSPSSTALDPTGDEDHDGLSNADEKAWGTDPYNPDTDGDGFKDGEEVRTGHNPTIAGPNDKLPPGFIPGKGVPQTAPNSTPAPTPGNLLPPVPEGNLTELYQKTVPTSEQSSQRFAAFVDAQPIVSTLPTIPDSSFQTLPGDSKQALTTYLEVVNKSFLENNGPLIKAITTLTEGNIGPMKALVADYQAYQQKLTATPVPPSAVDLHRMLIGYTQIVIATLQQSQVWPEDQARAMVALREFQAVRLQYFNQIISAIESLQIKASTL